MRTWQLLSGGLAADCRAMPCKILIVDDDKEIRKIYSSFFKHKGCEIIKAATGQEAMAAFERHSPSAVILDYLLPDLDGLQLLEMFMARRPDVVVIIVTAHGDIKGAVRAMKLGANNYLSKPVGLNDLWDVVQEGMASKSSGASPALPGEGSYENRLEKLECALLEQVLEEAKGNKTKVAQILQMSRKTLYRKLKKLGLL